MCYPRNAVFKKTFALKMSKKELLFYVIIEQDEDGNYIGEVPQLTACYSQGKTIVSVQRVTKQ
jgi:hypothetical protein